MRLFSDTARKRILSLSLMTLAVSAMSYLTQPSAHAQNTLINPDARHCAPQLRLSAQPGAMIQLDAVMPCQTNARVEVTHGPMRFSALTDGQGRVSAILPALTDTAEVRLSTGTTVLSGRITAPDASRFTRVALQWQGDAPLQIHALELASAYGGAGHIWLGDSKAPLRAVRDKGGFLTELGTPQGSGWQAQVYSFPADPTGSGVVRLSVETEVTAHTCGREIRGETIQADFAGQPRAMPMMLRLPGCQAVGETLVLKNLLRDLKLALK
ncbi:hypothetical protein ILP92_02360 [Maribius pontilimi]|uniref:Translocase n=1 Tax=Palleronia pontilimi TaxID=1964209 RepID=A0A934IEB0_9RHOB|nr:hypothetical protein [Palleronia pontilimi]MBJ3761592.1 hypothetical protein [Palleronia pontilimi]